MSLIILTKDPNHFSNLLLLKCMYSARIWKQEWRFRKKEIIISKIGQLLRHYTIFCKPEKIGLSKLLLLPHRDVNTFRKTKMKR